MTVAELEQIAQKMRYTGLNLSWTELIQYSEDVVGNLVEAYQVLLQDSDHPNSMTSDNAGNAEKMHLLIQEKIHKALVSLAGPANVARWESGMPLDNYTEPLTGNCSARDNK